MVNVLAPVNTEVAPAPSTSDIGIPRSFDQLQGPEHAMWQANRRALLRIKHTESWPGCAGLAFVPTLDANVSLVGNHMFVPNDALAIATLVTIPWNKFHDADNRDVRLATVTRAKMRHGVTINMADPLLCVDFNRCPFNQMRKGHGVQTKISTAGEGLLTDTLNADKHPREFQLFNRLQRNVIATGAVFQSEWQQIRPSHAASLRYGDDDNLVTRLPDPASWMPMPYVSSTLDTLTLMEALSPRGVVNLALQALFVDAVSHGLPIHATVSGTYLGRLDPPQDAVGFMRTKVDYHCIMDSDEQQHILTLLKGTRINRVPGDKVRKGDEIGFCVSLMSPKWNNLPTAADKFDMLDGSIFGRDNTLFHLWTWMERQMVKLDGEWHIPYDLVSVAATNPKYSDSFKLTHWDFGQSAEFFNETTGAWIVPTLQLQQWNDWHHALPYDVRMSLQPHDARVILNQARPHVSYHSKMKARQKSTNQ